MVYTGVERDLTNVGTTDGDDTGRRISTAPRPQTGSTARLSAEGPVVGAAAY